MENHQNIHLIQLDHYFNFLPGYFNFSPAISTFPPAISNFCPLFQIFTPQMQTYYKKIAWTLANHIAGIWLGM